VAFKKIELTVNPPDPIKLGHLTITFSTGDKLNLTNLGVTSAYNTAISEVVKKRGLYILPQSGGGMKPGYHMWEVWSKTDEETLKSFLPEIHKRAKEVFKELNKMKTFHHWLSQIKSGKM
jgi:hypothetical protein